MLLTTLTIIISIRIEYHVNKNIVSILQLFHWWNNLFVIFRINVSGIIYNLETISKIAILKWIYQIRDIFQGQYSIYWFLYNKNKNNTAVNQLNIA